MKNIILTVMSIMTSCLLASPIKSGIGARSICTVDSEAKQYTAADYIQDGLIAMYDGIENVGIGQHDNAATNWIDLVGTNSGVLAGIIEWGANCLHMKGSNYVILPEYNETGWTTIGVVEFVCQAPIQDNRFFFDLFQSDRTGFCLGRYTKWYETYVTHVAMLYQALNGTVSVSRSAIHYNGDDVTVNPNDNFSRNIHNRIGCRGTNSGMMTGDIYNVRLYSRVLTKEEMA